jgi:putative peptidoglycan lipid II flippase
MNASKVIGIISLITLISKVTGFAREMVIAGSYGAGVATDAFRVAQGIPTLFFTSIGTALATVLIPIFTQNFKEGGKDKAFSFARKLTTITLVITGGLSLLGVIAAPWVVRLFAPGFSGQAYDISVQLTRIMFPGLLFTVLAYLATGVLQSLGQFTVPALTGLPMNFIVIAVVLTIGSKFGIYALAWSTLVGIMLQYLIQWPSLRKRGYCFYWKFDLQDPSIRQVGKLITPVILGTAILQINTLVDRMFASNLPAGSISVLDYCNKLTGLVTGIIIIAVGAVALPKFSQLAVSEKRGELSSLVGQVLSALNALIIPMAVGLAVLRVPIVRFVYERGAFTPQDTELTASALLFGSVGLVGVGMREMAARAFYALKDTMTPMINGIIAVIVNIVLLFLFVGRFNWGIAGMASASSCSFLLSGIFLTVLLKRKLGSIELRSFLGSLWRSCVAATIMAVAIWLLYPILDAAILGTGFLAQAIKLCLTIIASVIVYIVVLTLLRAKEAQYGWAILGDAAKKIRQSKTS